MSSKVLGVVEKSDSVSWVLEIDESPVTVASRMLRRANSLRGVPSKWRNTSAKNQQSLTLPIRIRNSVSSSSSSSESAHLAVNRKRLSLDSVEKVGKEGTKKMDESDIAPFFDFLHDSSLNGSRTSEIENGSTKDATSALSSSSSFSSSSPRSSSSLELDEDEQVRSKSACAPFVGSIESIDGKGSSQERKHERFGSSEMLK